MWIVRVVVAIVGLRAVATSASAGCSWILWGQLARDG